MLEVWSREKYGVVQRSLLLSNSGYDTSIATLKIYENKKVSNFFYVKTIGQNESISFSKQLFFSISKKIITYLDQ